MSTCKCPSGQRGPPASQQEGSGLENSPLDTVSDDQQLWRHNVNVYKTPPECLSQERRCKILKNKKKSPQLEIIRK